MGTDIFRVQKHNKDGTVRWICTNERCNASLTLRNNKIIRIVNQHCHGDRLLLFHVGEAVNEFKKAVVNDLLTPIPQVYDRFVKKFVRSFF